MTDTKKAPISAARGIDGGTERAVYRCATCNLVLRQEPWESPPPYCPNCAILHLTGEMKRARTNAPGTAARAGRRRGRDRLPG